MKWMATLALMLVVACAEDVERAPFGNGDGNISALMDGAEITGSLGVRAARATNGGIQIFGNASNNRLITLNFVGVTGPGTYQLGAGSASYGKFSQLLPAWISNLPGGTGSVTFTVLTGRRATGTFTFLAPANSVTGAAGSKNFTNGVFDVVLGN